VATGAWLVAGACLAGGEYIRPILVLASRDSQSRLEEAQIEGLRSVLPADVGLVIEYLDVKRLNTRPYYMEYYSMILFAKYKHRAIGAVVALNDDVVRVANHYRTNIFSRAPLIVCGSSTAIMDECADRSRWTGVFSNPDMEETINWALTLHPEAKQVFVVTDRTPLGRLAGERLAQASASGRIAVPVAIPGQEPDRSYWGVRDVRGLLRHVPRESVAFFAEFYYDTRQRVAYPPQNLLPLLSRESKVPIYTAQSDAIGVGAVGGHVVNGWQMGQQAGRMVQRVLTNESPAAIPPVFLEGEWLFDAVQLKRWGISDKSLPAGSRIINRPVSFYEQHKKVIWLGGGISLLEAFIIAQLLMSRARRLRAQRALAASETRYRRLYETSRDVFTIVDLNGRVLHANPAASHMLGYASSHWSEVSLWQLIAPEDRTKGAARMAAAIDGVPGCLETAYVTRAGERMPVELRFQSCDFGGQPAVVCCGYLLSERLQMQAVAQEISERERQAFGHDVHDGLGQYVTALRFQLRLLEQSTAAGRMPHADLPAKLSGIVVDLASELRSIARSLVPLQMAHKTLQAALQENNDILRRLFLVDAALDFALDETRISAEAAPHLYRIAQEAARNAVRHGGAKSLRVVVRGLTAETGELVVENDGSPFERSPARRAGLGLSIMEQRARMIGGTLAIQAGAEQGTRVSCRFPLEAVGSDKR